MVQSPGVKASASALEFVSREDTKRDAFPRPCLWLQDIYQNLPRSESYSPLASNLDKPAVHSAFEGGLRVGAVIHGHGRLPKKSRLGRYCYLTSLPVPRPVPAAADRPYQLGCQCGPLPDVDSFNKFVRLLCHLHLRPISVPVPNPCSGHRPLSPRMSVLAGGYPWPALRGAPCSVLCSSGSCREVTMGLGASLLQADLCGAGSSQSPHLQRPTPKRGDSHSGVQGLAPPADALGGNCAPTLGTDWACCDHWPGPPAQVSFRATLAPQRGPLWDLGKQAEPALS